jgi:hypothetical protein
MAGLSVEHTQAQNQRPHCVARWFSIADGDIRYTVRDVPTLLMRMRLATLRAGPDEVFDALERLVNERRHCDG